MECLQSGFFLNHKFDTVRYNIYVEGQAQYLRDIWPWDQPRLPAWAWDGREAGDLTVRREITMIYRYKELFPPSNRWLCTKYRPHTGHLPAIHMKSLINTVQTETDITAEPSLFRGTCGYLLCKEDKNCSHLHLHVYRMYCGSASKPNQSACCYTVT